MPDGSLMPVDARVRLPVDRRPATTARPAAMERQEYDRVLDMGEKVRGATVAALLTSLREHGVGHAVVHAEYEGGEDAAALNAATVELVGQHPGLLSGFGTITMPPATAGRTAREVQACADAGLIGVNIQPAFAGMDMHDRRLYPGYARAEELGLIVAVHTGVHYSRVYPMAHERPEFLDQIACDFPDLRLVACHGGWPWVAEYCAVARRHPTVWLELGGLSPKYVTRPGTGWDVLAGYLNNLLREQVLFGTDWPIFGHERALREWRAGGLRDHTLDAVLAGNARRLFGLPSA
ncbi:amidohydrolase family protein [Pseudonocardia acaciae]|uniref:amidohydrolase family protein n=1 Tax=Pseudonocardia acaciae TaxID=551276 RepID=UPI001B800C74|nr:amidohydrolase family protein [Pseudonocardia acaciae]